MLRKCLESCRDPKYANSCIAIIFTISIFLQCCLFHYIAYQSVLVSALWKNPMSFLIFYMPKLSISFFVASFIFLFKKKGWCIVASLLVSVWIVAELVYFRANRIFLDAHSFLLLEFMDGFWSSVPIYLYRIDLLLLLPTLMLCLVVYVFRNKNKSILAFWGMVIVALLLNCSVWGVARTQQQQNVNVTSLSMRHFNPFSDSFFRLMGSSKNYIYNTSVLHAFIHDVQMLILLPFESRKYQMTDDELIDVYRFINKGNHCVEPQSNLVIILVESLESWAIRPEITPNLWAFMENHNVIWSKRVASQTKGGTSSDGQMILNTGLLPIQNGAVCKTYPNNVFPSLSEIYASSALVQPGDMSVWNQKYMSDAYGIDTNYLSPRSLDHETFSILNEIRNDYGFIMAITMASHSPFVLCAGYSSLKLPQDMPDNMANYLKCLHYSDSCWGNFLSQIDTMSNTVICFQGDHIIFDLNLRMEFESYCKKNNLDYDVQNSNTAFIAYSPRLTKSWIIEEQTYQMDAFPTILHLIGCDHYYWKGFGVNLLDSVKRGDRMIVEQNAFELSDKIIRSNFFELMQRSIKE